MFEGALWLADLDRVVVWGVGQQIHQLAAPLLDEFPYPFWPVGAEVIYEHYLSFTQARS